MNNIDTIDVVYSESIAEDGTPLEYMSLILNGEAVSGCFDPFAFVCSRQLKHSMLELLTCSCGNAGCAGIFYGTKVKRRRYTVEWRDIDCGFPKKCYIFDCKAYDAAAEKALQHLFALAEKRETLGYIDREDCYGMFQFRDVNDLKRGIKNTTDWLQKYHVI